MLKADLSEDNKKLTTQCAIEHLILQECNITMLKMPEAKFTGKLDYTSPKI